MTDSISLNETNRATYLPEDNKLRLYIGRVPRAEYLKLKEEGWKALHKQREAGGGDFVATWTPSRRETALAYSGGVIDDEDMSPAERAADRAERFAGYREKRLGESTGHADRFDAGPSAHGFQDYGRAVRSADRHDRIAGRAVDAWGKAEYWQRRTAGVIGHALYKLSPAVRMGRINELESYLRRLTPGSDWHNHTSNRLAYERQMLAAAGGVLEQCDTEVVAGGKLGGKLILKVHKSPVTKRPKSVDVVGPKVDRWTYRATNIPGTEFAFHSFDLERFDPRAYTPPTPESLAELEEFKTKLTASRKRTDLGAGLINPTDADAERLQALWNKRIKARLEGRKLRGDWAEAFVPTEVHRMNQATYSAVSGGTYSSCYTVELSAGGERNRRKEYGPNVCKIRMRSGHGSMANHVIVITDKPRKPLPASIWGPVPEEDTSRRGVPMAPDPNGNRVCISCDHTNQVSAWRKSKSAIFTSGVVCPHCSMHQEGQRFELVSA